MFDYVPTQNRAEITWNSDSENKNFTLAATRVEEKKNPSSIEMGYGYVVDSDEVVRYHNYFHDDNWVGAVAINRQGNAFMIMRAGHANRMVMRIPKSIAKKTYQSVKNWEQGGY